MIKEIKISTLKSDVVEDYKKFLSSVEGARQNRAVAFDQLFSFALDGQQWTQAEKDARDGKPALTFNNCADYVYRYLVKLFPFTPTGVLQIGVKVHEKNKNKKEEQEGEILKVYRQNGLNRKIIEQGLDFLAGGAGCLYYPLDPATKKVKIISLDPKTVFLGWNGGELETFAFSEDLDDEKKRITLWTIKNCFVFENDEVAKAYEHSFGFIPFSWIPNYPKPHKHEGRSKVLELKDLDREFNFRASDFSSRIEQNTEPERVVFSDNVGTKDSDKFERGKKKTHFLGKDDDMKNLELTEGQQILDYLKMLDEKFNKKTGLVESSGAVKSAVSGISLSFQYSDMLDQIGFMRVFWDEAFVKMNSAILTYKFGQGDYDTEPVYNPALMYDSKQRVDEYAVMLDKKIISRRDAIDELRGAENADEKLQEILEEDKEFNPPADPNADVVEF